MFAKEKIANGEIDCDDDWFAYNSQWEINIWDYEGDGWEATAYPYYRNTLTGSLEIDSDKYVSLFTQPRLVPPKFSKEEYAR